MSDTSATPLTDPSQESPAQPGVASRPAQPGGASRPAQLGGASRPAQPGGASRPAQPGGATPEAEAPLLRILTPGATDEEIAALVAVVSALATSDASAPGAPGSEWSAHHRKVRAAYRSGPGGWRSSGMP